MTSFNQIVLDFNSMVKEYRFTEALDKFYDAAVVSADNTNPAIHGLKDLIAEAQNFIEHAQIDFIELKSVIVEENLTVSNWHYKFLHKKFGQIDTNQISVQRWANGKIIQEHHFYNPAP